MELEYAVSVLHFKLSEMAVTIPRSLEVSRNWYFIYHVIADWHHVFNFNSATLHSIFEYVYKLFDTIWTLFCCNKKYTNMHDVSIYSGLPALGSQLSASCTFVWRRRSQLIMTLFSFKLVTFGSSGTHNN